MQKSMTGYGKGEAAAGDVKFSVEIKSLNSKQLDLSVRMPSRYRPLEYELRNALSKSVVRGKVEVSLGCESSKATPRATVNRDIFRNYFEQFAALGLSEWDTPQVQAAALSTIAALPETVNSETGELSPEETAAVNKATAKALEAFDAFRTQEGEKLEQELLGRVETILSLREKVTPLEGERIEAVRKKIAEGIEALALKPDMNRLEQEMIFYIEKMDVTEEKVRLQAHCDYFREVAATEAAAGRKLGFIAQEMGREINTLGSKASHQQIQKIVVEMKDELEKIKEQILNIL